MFVSVLGQSVHVRRQWWVGGFVRCCVPCRVDDRVDKSSQSVTARLLKCSLVQFSVFWPPTWLCPCLVLKLTVLVLFVRNPLDLEYWHGRGMSESSDFMGIVYAGGFVQRYKKMYNFITYRVNAIFLRLYSMSCKPLYSGLYRVSQKFVPLCYFCYYKKIISLYY